MKLLLLVILMGVTPVAQPTPGPLGFTFGVPPPQGVKCERLPDLPSAVRACKCPQRHPQLGELCLVYLDERGSVVKVGSFASVDTDLHGVQARSSFTVLLEALTRKYGAPETLHDFLTAGSLWDEPRDWTIGLLRGERYLSAYWTLPGGGTIFLQVTGVSVQNVNIAVTWESPAFEKVKRANDAEADKAL